MNLKYINLLPSHTISISCDSNFSISNLNHQISISENPDAANILIKTNGEVFRIETRDKKVKKVLQIPKEGPGGLSGQSDQDGMIFFNDTLWGYTHSWKHKSYLLKPLDAKEVFSLPDDGTKAFIHTQFSHPINNGQTILIPIYNHPVKAKGTDTFSFLRGNLDTEKFEFVIPSPPLYSEAYWGGAPWQYLPSVVYLASSKEYVVSFPLDHHLYVYDEAMKLKRKTLLPSQDLPENFTPFQKEYNENTFDYLKDRKYYGLLSYYFGLVHDPANHRIYRVVRIVKPDPNNPNSDPISSKNLVVCDEKLNYLGEWKIPPQYDPSASLFVNKQGLWLLDDEKLNPEETLLTFDIFDGKFKQK